MILNRAQYVNTRKILHFFYNMSDFNHDRLTYFRPTAERNGRLYIFHLHSKQTLGMGF